MTENVKTNNLLGSSFITIDELITSDASTAVNQLNKTLYVNPNMAVENTCIYTAPLPAELTSTFPEGTVLQMLPDSTLIAIPPIQKYSQASTNNTSLIFKDTSSLSTKILNDQNSTVISNLLMSSNQNEAQTAEAPICSEGSISDIDLSFLNETEESTSKSLNETEVKELQTMIDIVEPSSISALPNNPSNIIGCNLEHSQTKPLSPKQPEASTEDVVMIDVSKPIQLSQNTMITVNGRKCILQQDAQTGQVIAYPVKEPDKPRRKRGRPRKVSIEQIEKEPLLDMEPVTEINASEDEKEKGLLEIVNDDGSLVRRSSRKRKRARVLKDYETGNLKQELGSDIEDGVSFEENEVRKRKHKNLGRPKKHVSLQLTSELSDSVNESIAGKRPRGRPRKPILGNEPSQAFLVQTADGQTLMMQVPLSSIPEGVTLQEVAQSIANKLNVGLNMSNNSSLGNGMQSNSKGVTTEVLLNTETNPNIEKPIEPVVQDHSIGSTTNCNANENSFRNETCIDDGVDSSCQNTVSDFHEIVADSVSQCQEAKDEAITDCKALNTKSNSFLPEQILENHFSNVQSPHCSQTNFSGSIPTSNSSSVYTSPVLPSLPTQVSSNPSNEQNPLRSITQDQLAKDFLIDGDFLKDKVNIHMLLQNVETSEELNLATKIQHSEEISSSIISEEFPRNSGDTFEYSEANINNKNSDHIIQEISNFVDSNKALENFLNYNNASESNCNSHVDKESSRNLAIISSIEHDHDFLLQGKKCSNASENQAIQSSISELNFIDSKTQTETNSLQNILPLENIAPIIDSSVLTDGTNSQTVISETQHSSEKILPVILPVEEKLEIKKCKVCHKTFDTDDDLFQHYKSTHPKNICNDCNYTSEHSYVVKRHSLRHTNNGCICSICGKLYKDHYILKMHIKMVHLPAETIYTCNVCNKEFTRKAHLKRHLRIHQPNRPYQCTFCSYRGVEKSDIKKHLLVHDTPKHKCPVCGKCFRYTKNRELHLKRHYKQRDYKCGLCDFYGYTFTDIRKHIERRHAGSKCLNCTDCGLLFKNKETLEEHKNSNQCQKCLLGKELSQNYTLSNKSILEDMPVDILDESEQSHVTTSVDNEQTSQQVQLKLENSNILNSAEEILCTSQNEQLIINEFGSSNILHSENLSVLPEENGSSKLIAIVSRNKDLTLPLKPVESLENVLTSVNKQEIFLLPDSINIT